MPAPALLSDPAMVRATGTSEFAAIYPIARATDPRLHQRAALSAVAADRFNRAAFHGLFAERFFFRSIGLLVNEGMSAVVVPFVIRRRSFPAEITVDALVIDVELPLYVFRILVCNVGHRFARQKRNRT
jgi:hypothetical protein